MNKPKEVNFWESDLSEYFDSFTFEEPDELDERSRFGLVDNETGVTYLTKSYLKAKWYEQAITDGDKDGEVIIVTF